MKKILTILIIAAAAAPGAASEKALTGLSIYNNNFAVVRETRRMNFSKGINTVKFTDVASSLDPTTVNFECLGNPGAVSILEQNYEYDLVSPDSLLKRYTDREITVQISGSGADTGREISGTLMAFMNGSLIIKSCGEEIEIIDKDNIEAVSLQKSPEDLVTRPTLLWLADSRKDGPLDCRVTYTTEKLGWDADYSAILNEDETALSFSGWVTIKNNSGKSYQNSEIKLIAGDVRKIKSQDHRKAEYMKRDMVYSAAPPAFEEKSFMEYHMYTLSRRSTIKNNQIKQIEFIEPVPEAAVEKLYIYDRRQYNDKIQVRIEFKNTEKNKLGIPLPKGRVRVFKKDLADGMLEFVGEDSIDHTPREEKISLYIGNAFDIAVEYKQIDSKHDRRRRTDSHLIELRNQKDEAVTVYVDEKFSKYANWKIDESTHDYKKYDSSTARFEVKIEAGETAELRYTATQWWN